MKLYGRRVTMNFPRYGWQPLQDLGDQVIAKDRSGTIGHDDAVSRLTPE